MKITNLQIKNFRNYPNQDLAITSDMVVLSGPNAVGKTNLMESIYFGSLFKSFRDDAETIFLHGTTNSEIKIEIEQKGNKYLLEIFLEKRDKIFANFKIDGVKKKRKEAQGYLKVVIFEPTDVDLFTKMPETRRKYLNMVISQKSSEYVDNLVQYKKILTQKNKLLQDIKNGLAGKDNLVSWNEQQVEIGSQIINERKNFINFLNQNISEVYAGITQFHRPIEVVYETIPGETIEEIKTNFSEALEKISSKEIAVGMSLIGPHRDDFDLKSEGLYLVSFSSRGEQRSQVLALKILELEYLKDGEDTPILLLDDVLSELDDIRRTYFLKYLQGKYQTFITTTHPLEMVGQHITLSPSVKEE